MSMITRFATKFVVLLTVVALIASPAAAQGLSAPDIAFAFGGQAMAPASAQRIVRSVTPETDKQMAIASARSMTHLEMQETEGAFWPLSMALL